MRILSMGGGINSMACLVLFHLNYDAVIWADTGNESLETYKYIEEQIKPFCKDLDLEFVTVRAKTTVLEEALTHKKVSFYFKQRQCTTRHKIRPILKWVKAHGATKDNVCTIDIGFAIDESTRIGKDYDQTYATKRYPLCETRVSRLGCIEAIRHANIPIPPKSACDFCPFAGRKNIREFSVKQPEKFNALIKAEEKDPKFPKYTIFRGQTLRAAINNTKLEDYDDSCDSGHCSK